MKKEFLFQTKVQELFGYSTEDYRETKESDITICISFRTGKIITFNLLKELSSVLNTSHIDIEPETQQIGYCESCAGDRGVHYIICRRIPFGKL